MGRFGIFAIVPQQQAYVVEFLGKFQKVLSPGWHIQIPYVQRVPYIHNLKEQAIEVHEQEAVTKDNVHLNIDGVLYLQVYDAYKASYGASDPVEYCYILAQSIMRAEIGKMRLDAIFEERDALNHHILETISRSCEDWGVKCLRYEIKDVNMHENFKKVMNLEAESERKKRAEIQISEGLKMADINIAEGYKTSRVREAEGEATKIWLQAQALGNRIKLIAESLNRPVGANLALKYKLAENYLDGISGLAHPSKNVILKKSLNDPVELFEKAFENFENDGQEDSVAKK